MARNGKKVSEVILNEDLYDIETDREYLRQYSGTTDYSKFKSIRGNRDLNRAHVARLANHIKRKNLLPFYPVLVNENMEVIDGQHRIAAAKALGMEVSYVRVNGLRIEDVMAVNTASKEWGINDFVEAYVKLGVEDYKKLKEFKEKYNLPVTMAAQLLAKPDGKVPTGGTDLGSNIRSGTYIIADEEKATELAEQLNILNEFTDFRATSDRHLMRALWHLYTVAEFDFGRLEQKLRSNQLKLEKQGELKYYILKIEEAYNHNAKIRVDLYRRVKF